MSPLRFLFVAFAIMLGACLLFRTAFGAPLEFAIGDSLAVGLGLPGSAKVGIGPRAVFERICAFDPEGLRGRVVVLSTGLSNDMDDTDDAKASIDALHLAGAKVIVLGVGGMLPGSLEVNQWLKDYAVHYGMPYIDGWMDVHPKDYRVLLDNVRWFECVTYHICGA